MSEKTIGGRLREIVEEIAPTAEIEENDGATPLEDLGLDSLDISGLLLAIEEQFGLKIPDEEVEKLTCLDDYAAYIQKHG